jgi:hypothetical protein
MSEIVGRWQDWKPSPFHIKVEGSILVGPDGDVMITGFVLDGGTLDDLRREVARRVEIAAATLRSSVTA